MLNIAEYFPITDPTLIFFVVLLIILFAPIIMGKLRIPHIIGMVLAGILVGKYGLLLFIPYYIYKQDTMYAISLLYRWL